MNGLNFSSDNLICLGVESFFMILLPIPLLILYKKKTRLSLKIFITGAVTFFLFAIVLKVLPAMPLFYGENDVARTIRNTPLLYYLTAGILAGVFEETGRFIAFKTVLKKDTAKQTSIAYGIGHGGFECIYLAVNIVYIMAIGIMINQNGIESITKDMNSEQIEIMTKQLKDFTNADITAVLLALMERISTVMIHIALSILVFRSVHDKKLWFLFPTAIFIHALFDFSIVIHSYGVPDIVLELILLITSFTVFILSYKLVYAKSE